MPDRTYAEMEREVDEYFDNVTDEELDSALKRAKFDFFNQINTVVLTEPIVMHLELNAQETLFSVACKVPFNVTPSFSFGNVQMKFSHFKPERKRTNLYRLAA